MLACLLFIFRIEDSILRYIILAALVVRVGLALIQAYTGIDLPGAGADSTSFEKDGWLNARAWRANKQVVVASTLIAICLEQRM